MVLPAIAAGGRAVVTGGRAATKGARVATAPSKTRNARRVTRHSDKTVPGTFIRKKSLSAQSQKRTQNEETSTDVGASKVAHATYASSTQSQVTRSAQRRVQRRTRARVARRLFGFSNWTGLSIITVIYIWQFVFALLSLVGFGALGFVIEFKERTLTGQALSFFENVFGVSVIPTEHLGYIGLGFWGLATLLAVGVFVTYLFWYHIQGIRPFARVTSFLITTIALSLSMLPVTNLFPWLILWVLYMNTTSLFLRTSG